MKWLTSFRQKQAERIMRLARRQDIPAGRRLRLLGKLAAQGDADASFMLGMTYLENTNVPRHHPTAVSWMTRAAENGHPSAYGVLAALALRGLTVAEGKGPFDRKSPGAGLCGEGHGRDDTRRRARFYALSGSARGDARAIGILAGLIMEETGFSSPDWEPHALRAADLGDAPACLLMAKAAYAARPFALVGTKDQRASVEAWMSCPLKEELVGAYFFQAQLHDNGFLPNDKGQAMTWMRRAALKGHLPALYLLGRRLLQDGDDLAGVSFLRKAALSGHSDAAATLGDHALRLGDRAGILEAVQWYGLALDHGHEGARKMLGALVLSGKLPQFSRRQGEEWYYGDVRPAPERKVA